MITRKEPLSQQPEWLRTVAHVAREIRFGEVKITIRDGKPVRIDRTESTLLPDTDPRSG